METDRLDKAVKNLSPSDKEDVYKNGMYAYYRCASGLKNFAKTRDYFNEFYLKFLKVTRALLMPGYRCD